MTPEILSTHGLPPTQQGDAWRALFSSVFELEEPAQASQGFLAESRYWALDGFGIGEVSAPALRATRTKELVRRNSVDHWCLTLGQRETRILTPKDTLVVPAQTPFLVSLGVDMASERASDKRLHLYLPRDGFADMASQLDAARGIILDTGLGRLLGHFVRNLALSLPGLTPYDVPNLTAAVRTMIGACVVPSPDRLELAAAQIDEARLQKLTQIVRRNIESPALGAGMLCGALGVSRTRLYRLLQHEGGVERYIRKIRLEVSHARLSDVSNTSTIGEIAARLGFTDASQFSRTFRREFGASPSEVRLAAMDGGAAEPASQVILDRQPLNRLLAAL